MKQQRILPTVAIILAIRVTFAVVQYRVRRTVIVHGPGRQVRPHSFPARWGSGL